jgi:hypothetical protein
MAPPVWRETARTCFRTRNMAETGLQVRLTLPFDCERRSLPHYAQEALWAEGLMILRVINQMEAQAPREGEVEAPVARLEAKLDLVLHLLALSLQAAHVPPPAAEITLWAEGCTLATESAWQPGDAIVLSLYLSPALALPLKLAATVIAQGNGELHAHWRAMPEAVQETWEQWLFRQHRRMVQGQRGQK